MKNSDSSKTDAKDTEKSKKDVLAPVSYFRLFRYATPFDIFLDVVGTAAAMAAGAAQPMLALLFGVLSQNFISFAVTVKQFQDGLASEADVKNAAVAFRHDASRNAVYFVIAGIVVLVCTFLYMYTWTYTGEVNSKRIREHYLQAILRQDVEYFDEVGAGEVATRIQSDTHLVQQGISEKVAMAAHFSAAFIVGFILAFTQSWRLALAMTSILPALMVTGALMGRFMTRYSQMSTDRLASAGTIAEESISTIRTAKAFGIQFHIGALFDDKIAQAGRSDVKNAITQGSGFAAFFFINYAAYALAFSFGTTLLNRGLINAGQVITVFMSIFIGSFSLTVIAPEVIAISTARGAAAKLFATIDRVPAIDSSSPSGIKPETIAGDIVLENVTFTYPSRPDVTVLHDISMTFSAGKSFALVGPSGSGKSTIISLIERFYDPTRGAIKLDDNDLKSVNVKWLRRQIGLVSQEPVLFGTSVTKNVAFGLIGTPYEFAPKEEQFELIKQACIKANAHDFISRLPKGYDTTVGERGFLLSGGQKQRVAIARAIVSDPRILLLDEATSALDTQSEEVVQDALSKASEGRTTITIAHRLSTIKNADKIYVMSEGKIVEEGSHEQLMNARGVYSRLVEAQGLKTHIRGTPTPVGTNTPIPQAAEDFEKGALTEEILMDRINSSVMEKPTTDSTTGKTYSISYLTKRMGVLVKDEWRSFFLGFLFSIAVGLVYPAFGVVYALSINGFAEPDPRERRRQGDRNALWFFIMAIISGITMGGQNYFLSSAAATLAARLRKLSFRAILRQDIEFFDKETNTSGVLTSRITGDPGKVNGLAGITLGTIIQSLTTVLAGIIAGIAIVWQIGLVGLACTPFLLSAGYSRLHAVMLKDAKDKEAHAQSAQVACECAGAIRTVAALTREDACLEEYKASLAAPLSHAVRTGALSTFLYAFSQAAMFFVIALVFWLGAVLFSRLEITVFQLFVGLMSTTLGALHAGSMFQFAPDMSAAKGAASNIITLLDSPSSIESDTDSGEKFHSVRGRIEAKDVCFSYPSRLDIPVLKGINFTAEPGQYIAFVGASGSGKSTIIQLLQRFYDIKSGSIHIDDSSLRELNLADYRKDAALVSQEPTLYSGTIRFNILLGATKPHPEVTQSELEEACRKANILDFINGLPEGFETEVGNKGSQLSGGQKQRIAIARALIRNPKILLLDEATSALDSASEKVVQVALDEAAKGRTTIAIAHRLSTIQDADKIYFIKHGRVSESGTHNELLSLQGDYYDYVQLQTLQQDT